MAEQEPQGVAHPVAHPDVLLQKALRLLGRDLDVMEAGEETDQKPLSGQAGQKLVSYVQALATCTSKSIKALWDQNPDDPDFWNKLRSMIPNDVITEWFHEIEAGARRKRR